MLALPRLYVCRIFSWLYVTSSIDARNTRRTPIVPQLTATSFITTATKLTSVARISVGHTKAIGEMPSALIATISLYEAIRP